MRLVGDRRVGGDRIEEALSERHPEHGRLLRDSPGVMAHARVRRALLRESSRVLHAGDVAVPDAVLRAGVARRLPRGRRGEGALADANGRHGDESRVVVREVLRPEREDHSDVPAALAMWASARRAALIPHLLADGGTYWKYLVGDWV